MKTLQLFELYKAELFSETRNDEMEQMNRQIKLLNSVLTKKNNIIENYSPLSGESVDENEMKNMIKKKHHHHHHHRKASKDSSKTFDIFNFNQNFPGTMYFPKPPKEFAMEEMIDEPESHEVCLKPIPTVEQQKSDIDGDSKHDNNPKILIEQVSSQNHSKMNNSLSFQDLTEIKTMGDGALKQTVDSKKSSNDDIDLKSNNLNHAKFTFMELLRSDHCLICCGSIDTKRIRSNDSWPCKCIRTPMFVSKYLDSPKQEDQNNNDENDDKKSISKAPPFRRASLFDTEFMSLVGEKETFRESIAHKVENLIFYSDFATLASRIPYFQCDADFKSFK